VFAVVLLLISSVAEGADWKFCGYFGGCKNYYDASSVEELSMGLKKVWIISQADNEKCILDKINGRIKVGLPVKDYEIYSHTMVLEKIDCALEKTSTETVTDYDNEGNVLHSFTSSTEYWEEIVSDTIDYVLYGKICK